MNLVEKYFHFCNWSSAIWTTLFSVFIDDIVNATCFDSVWTVRCHDLFRTVSEFKGHLLTFLQSCCNVLKESVVQVFDKLFSAKAVRLEQNVFCFSTDRKCCLCFIHRLFDYCDIFESVFVDLYLSNIDMSDCNPFFDSDNHSSIWLFNALKHFNECSDIHKSKIKKLQTQEVFWLSLQVTFRGIAVYIHNRRQVRHRFQCPWLRRNRLAKSLFRTQASCSVRENDWRDFRFKEEAVRLTDLNSVRTNNHWRLCSSAFRFVLAEWWYIHRFRLSRLFYSLCQRRRTVIFQGLKQLS